jgi:hypothetical protein
MGCTDPTSAPRKETNLKDEKNAFRALLRKKNYLTSPFVCKPHKSLEGSTLDQSLVGITALGKDNEEKFISSLIQTESVRVPLKLVCVTQAERQKQDDIKSKTKTEIAAITFELLNQNGDDELTNHYVNVFNSTVRKQNKPAYIEFHTEVMAALSEQEYNQVEDDANTNDDDDDLTQT